MDARVDWGLESCPRHFRTDFVGWELDVDRSAVDNAFPDGSIDLLGGNTVVDQICLGDCDLGSHFGKDVVVAIAQCVMENHFVVLCGGRWCSHYVHHWCSLSV